MKILFLTQLLPWPPYSGGRQKTSKIIELLLSMGHTVEVICFNDVRGETIRKQAGLRVTSLFHPIVTASFKNIKKSVITNFLFSATPFQVSKYYDLRVVEKIKELLRCCDYDVMWCDHDTSLQYVSILRHLSPKTRIIYDEHNIMSVYAKRGIFEPGRSIFGRIFAIGEWVKYLLYERQIFNLPDHIFTISKMDKSIIESKYKSNVPVTWLPVPFVVKRIRSRGAYPPTVLVVGTWSWPPNKTGLRWFYDGVWPLIKEKNRKVKLIVAGQRFEGIRPWFTGDTSVSLIQPNEDLEAVYRQATLVVVPIKSGGGVKIKLLEALAYGMPVVTTSMGADGVDGVEGSVVRADNFHDFAVQVIRLLAHQKEAMTLSDKASLLMETTYSYAGAESVLVEIGNLGSKLPGKV